MSYGVFSAKLKETVQCFGIKQQVSPLSHLSERNIWPHKLMIVVASINTTTIVTIRFIRTT